MPRTRFLADVPITIYRQAPDLPDAQGNRPSLESRKLAEDCAHRRDQRVAESDLSGLQTFSIQRQYIVRKPETYTIRVPQTLETLGENPLAEEAVGEGAQDALPVARDGANAEAGLLLRDDETGDFFNITGVILMPDNKRLVIQCARTRGVS